MTHIYLFRHAVGVLAASLIFAPSAQAQVYKWVDERGVVTYGDEPPAAKRRSAKPVQLEDNLSVYTPDEGVREATKRARERSAQRSPEPPFSTPPLPAQAAAPAVIITPDAPCVSGFESSCQRGALVEGTVIHGTPRRAPRLNHPELPPGAIAGNVNAGTGAMPGLSLQQPQVQQPQVPRNARGERITPSASFTLKDIDERERARR